MRQNSVACGAKGHTLEGQSWTYDENGHWRKCSGYWLCGVVEAAQAHSSGNICEICKSES